jgi:uncharacterized protein YdaU (DUF1376 family)
MKRPWMPLYVGDYLAKTAHLNAAQSGAYLHLIMHYWQAGSLPEDDDMLARISRMTSAEWRNNKNVIASFFDDGWRHERIDEELALSKVRRTAGKTGASKRWGAHANGYQNDSKPHGKGMANG